MKIIDTDRRPKSVVAVVKSGGGKGQKQKQKRLSVRKISRQYWYIHKTIRLDTCNVRTGMAELGNEENAGRGTDEQDDALYLDLLDPLIFPNRQRTLAGRKLRISLTVPSLMATVSSNCLRLQSKMIL
mmetsp:Transcript_34585/g.83528  ORF Transcript_34585/g.83528 Transcript_34585/m.83528 type:complete len:128 (+) Transcript_34585:299-682(+)